MHIHLSLEKNEVTVFVSQNRQWGFKTMPWKYRHFEMYAPYGEVVWIK
jgi:hypothetical protein